MPQDTEAIKGSRDPTQKASDVVKTAVSQLETNDTYGALLTVKKEIGPKVTILESNAHLFAMLFLWSVVAVAALSCLVGILLSWVIFLKRKIRNMVAPQKPGKKFKFAKSADFLQE